jgi:hypothetical protein
MSDTPRTEAEVNRPHGPLDGVVTVDADFACMLERELNAAQQRIKRLEEAGNNLLWNFCPEYTSDFTESQSDALKQWNKAKEVKP